MPTRVHAIVLVSKLHKPTLRALAFAKATRPNVLEAIYVSIDAKATSRLLEEWDERNLDIPLKVLHSPYREIVRPIVEYAQEIRRRQPARRRGGLHPGVRRRALVGAAAAQPDGAAAQGPAALHARASWSSPCPTSCGPPRSPRSAAATRSACTPATCVAAASATRTGRQIDDDDAPVSRHNRPRRARGRSRVGERFEVEVGPGRPRRALRRPAPRAGVPRRVRAARAAGRAGRRRDHRGHRRRPVLARRRRPRRRHPSADRVEPPCPVRRPRALRRLRLPARRAARAARPQDGRGRASSSSGSAASTRRRTS